MFKKIIILAFSSIIILSCSITEQLDNLQNSDFGNYNPLGTNTPNVAEGASDITSTPVEEFDVNTISFIGKSCDSLNYELFNVPPDKYESIFYDGIVSEEEKQYLYNSYYEPTPAVIKGHGTLYGSDQSAIGGTLIYKDWMVQQMERGWVLVGSGKYGYHPELANQLWEFINKYYHNMDASDILLSKQASPLYLYFADGGLSRANRDARNQPIPLSRDDLNANQKRIYDITITQPYKMKNLFFVPYSEQAKMTERDALNSGKYIGVIAGKSINDFGRRELFYKCVDGKLAFVGVVLVGGEAKRDDWTGMGSPTNITFSFDHFPLATRVDNGLHWAFDVPQSLYELYGGTGGATGEIIAVDPDAILKGK